MASDSTLAQNQNHHEHENSPEVSDCNGQRRVEPLARALSNPSTVEENGEAADFSYLRQRMADFSIAEQSRESTPMRQSATPQSVSRKGASVTRGR
jgi:hypothetical protein